MWFFPFTLKSNLSGNPFGAFLRKYQEFDDFSYLFCHYFDQSTIIYDLDFLFDCNNLQIDFPKTQGVQGQNKNCTKSNKYLNFMSQSNKVIKNMFYPPSLMYNLMLKK